MKKLVFGIMMFFAFSTTAWAKDIAKTENKCSSNIELKSIDNNYYLCRITITRYSSDGKASVETRDYYLEGSQSACQTWCDNKATMIEATLQ